MYTKDKTQRITLRLNEEQFAFVLESSEPLGVSPSEFLRMVINATMSASKRIKVEPSPDRNAVYISLQEGGSRRENENAIQHDQL